ncbi:MAG: pyruvate/oxaloacetate carboxyltransferase [Bacteroidota bacterium]|nr:pyruvate/oxaloacetate carboxyltransferase [Bacteroidota bacterium]
MAQEILRITDTTLRDGHQSLWATRMRTDDILGIIDTIDAVGYYSLEVWGGATFDVCLRYLREDPWERLRLIKSRAKKTPLQMLLRGQNIVGYKNYPDDLVERFVEKAHENGIDIFRIFDALNDSRNLQAAIKAVQKTGAHAQGTLSYTTSPVHTVEKYVNDARKQIELGIDSLCIKDMAGLLSPTKSKELVTALKENFDIPIQIHCHATSGMAESAYLEGVKAGAGAVDGAISSMAGFSSQPPVETIHAIFKETEYDVNLDLDALRKVNKYFAALAPKRIKGRGHEPIIDAEILVHQIPGGMISNFRSQLEQQDALEKLPEALDEVSRVRKDLGYPPLVTPTSQIVGTQAVMNVITGERYKVIPQEVRNYVKGMYGRPPAPIDPALIKKILGKEKPIDHRPADDLKNILPTATKNISNPEWIKNEEDILSYCLFPEVSVEFFKWRAHPHGQKPKTPADIEIEELGNEKELPKEREVTSTTQVNENLLLNTEDFERMNNLLETASSMQLNELSIRKGDFQLTLRSGNGSANDYEFTEPVVEQKKPKQPQQVIKKHETKTAVEEKTGEYRDTIDSVMTGTFYSAPGADKPPFVKEGSKVKEGETICILEAMKLFNEIEAPFYCKIVKILVEDGTLVKKGQPIMAIEKL